MPSFTTPATGERCAADTAEPRTTKNLVDDIDARLMQVADGSLGFADFVDVVADLVSAARRDMKEIR